MGPMIYRRMDNVFANAGYATGWAASFNGEWMPLHDMGVDACVFMIYHEAITGVYTFQASSDPRCSKLVSAGMVAPVPDFVDITADINAIDPIPIPAGVAATDSITIAGIEFAYVRMSYTHALGAGQILRAYFSASQTRG
jgi:hypothetical protein